MSTATLTADPRQWYRARPADLSDRPELRAALELARGCLGDDLRIDSQWSDLGPGASIGIPIWQTATWADPAAVLLCLGDEDVLEVAHAGAAPALVPTGRPVRLGPADRVRLRPRAARGRNELVLVRAAEPDLAPARVRYSARTFQPSAPPPAPPVAVDWASRPVLRFESRPRVVAELEPATPEEIAAEPTFGACGLPAALAVGGPLLERFVAALPADWRAPGADVRVGVTRDELSPGWNPCGVAYHMDGTSRIPNKRPDGHADLADPGRTVDQMIACFGPGAPTRFVVGTLELPEPPLGDAARAAGARWAEIIAEGLASGRLEEWLAPPDTLIAFGHGDFHTGSTSRAPGWRCFVKAMRHRGDPMPGAAPLRHHDGVSRPIDGPDFPTDPCGVFPDDVL